MQLTVLVPDELGQRVRRLPDPDRFVTEAILRALPERSAPASESAEKTSRWARFAAEIEADPVHLDGYSEQLERDAREFRKDVRAPRPPPRRPHPTATKPQRP